MASLQTLHTLPPPTDTFTTSLRRQLTNGIAELIRTHACQLQSPADWLTVFSLLEYAGGMLPQLKPPATVGVETPDLGEVGVAAGDEKEGECEVFGRQVWVAEELAVLVQQPIASGLSNFNVVVEESLPVHDPESFVCCETLAFLVRSECLVSQSNFCMCVHCLRSFAEVSSSPAANHFDQFHSLPLPSRTTRPTPPGHAPHDQPSRDKSAWSYAATSLQLLDLMDSLYTRVLVVFGV